MPRYFIEVAYRGTNYSGFQVQKNANTIQAEVEKAFNILHRQAVGLTGSSRTDSGVHAFQNFFHFDYEGDINLQFVYKMNALLPPDVVIKNIFEISSSAHCRFDATSREYLYNIHRFKDPFLLDRSLYFPYKIDVELMQRASEILLHQTNFFAFAKTNSQVKNFNCTILKSQWLIRDSTFTYNIEANRFLRGMVRAVTATLLKVGRHKLSIQQFENMFTGINKAGYSVPGYGLFLISVKYPQNYFPAPGVPFTGF